MMRAGLATLLAGTVIGIAAHARANELSSPHAERAILTCDEVDHAQGMETMRKIEVLDGGVLEGELAVAADHRDPRAHLALFCNLGLQVELAGLSWRSLSRLQRAKEEIDRAFELAPDDPDVLTAKGTFLHRLPVVLGGDRRTGVLLLRRAVAARPDHVVAKLHLARALAEDGAPDARTQVYEVIALAKKKGARREQSEAQELLASMSR